MASRSRVPSPIQRTRLADVATRHVAILIVKNNGKDLWLTINDYLDRSALSRFFQTCLQLASPDATPFLNPSVKSFISARSSIHAFPDGDIQQVSWLTQPGRAWTQIGVDGTNDPLFPPTDDGAVDLVIAYASCDGNPDEDDESELLWSRDDQWRSRYLSSRGSDVHPV